MTAKELREYFISQLTNGECIFRVAKGKAKYKMSRGSFKTKKKIYDDHNLLYKNTVGNRYIFTDGKVEGELILDDNPNIVKFHFHVDTGYNRFFLSFKTFEDEHIYGCGEQFTTLDLKGKNVPIWVSEHQQMMKIAGKLLRWKIRGKPEPDRVTKYKNHQTYCSFPTFISSKNYGFYVHDDSYGMMCFQKDRVELRFRNIPKSVSMLLADSQKELVEKFAGLMGIAPRIPDWVNNGVILAMQGGTEVLRKKYQEAKAKGVKIAGIWAQDWCGHVVTSFGYQVYWNWAVDNELYKGLKEFIDELHADGVKFLGYINTFLKEGSPQFNEAKEMNILVRRENGQVYLIKSTTFDAGIVDLTNPTGYEWYKNIIKKNMIEFGLDGWMADFGEYLPTDSIVYGGEADKLHNKWPTFWAKCCYEAIHEMKKENDIFIFSRAAYDHTVKYTNSIWNGDNHVDWSDEYGIASVIPASLSLACCGCGVVHSDIGGYTTAFQMVRSAELLRRWSEMNIFTPVFRTHEGNRPKDNVQFDEETVIDEFAENSQIFAELKPYRIHVTDEYQNNGTPMIRPLFFHFDDERSKVEKREFLFGEDILAAPVLREGKTTHNVFLPKGKWVQFFTGREYEEGDHEIPSPLGTPIAFYRKGSEHSKLFEEITKNHFKGEKQ
ncbi:MAG: alpha-glucosidase [Bacilli bacterium]|nr:alpha-glucosidase [Bacilli bacterium]